MVVQTIKGLLKQAAELKSANLPSKAVRFGIFSSKS
jgi:hypothetical protein